MSVSIHNFSTLFIYLLVFVQLKAKTKIYQRIIEILAMPQNNDKKEKLKTLSCPITL
jgi:hypothetical protein